MQTNKNFRDKGMNQTEEKISKTEFCLNCGNELTGSYCKECGQKKFDLKDRSIKGFLLHLLDEFLDFDTKVIRTVKYLFLKPGFLTEEYIKGRIQSYVSPLKLYLFISLVVFFVDSGIDSDVYTSLTEDDFSKSALTQIREEKGMSEEMFKEKFNSGISGKLPIYTIGMVLMLSIVLRVIFIAGSVYLSEHFVFSLHFYSFLLVLFGIDSLTTLINADITAFIIFIPPLIYLILAVKRVYKLKTVLSLVVSGAVYLFYIFFIFAWYLFSVVLTAKLA